MTKRSKAVVAWDRATHSDIKRRFCSSKQDIFVWGQKSMATKTPSRRRDPSSNLGDAVIPVHRLHLNLSNPRHEPVLSESEAIAALCDNELITELARDIAERGSLSPLENLGVMPQPGNPGHYISLEGNRRTCALLILADPVRAPRELQPQIRKIADKANIPREIKVHIFQNAETAKQWIDLRHLGLQGGIGTKDWDPTQQARAIGSNTRSSARANTLALKVLDRLVQVGLLTPQQRRQISLTTLTRYLGTPGVRAVLGLNSPNQLVYTHDADEVDAALHRLALDSIEPLSDGSYRVNSRSNSKSRLAYANDLRKRGLAPTSILSEPIAPPQTQPGNARSQPGKQRSANHPDARSTIFDRRFTITNKDAVLGRLRKEALDLRIDTFQFSANYLLRAIIERIMILFAKKRGRFSDSLDDQKLTKVCAEELRSMQAPRGVLRTIQKAAGSSDTPYSLHSLGHAVHGGSVPTADATRAHFDTWEPVLRAMLDLL